MKAQAIKKIQAETRLKPKVRWKAKYKEAKQKNCGPAETWAGRTRSNIALPWYVCQGKVTPETKEDRPATILSSPSFTEQQQEALKAQDHHVVAVLKIPFAFNPFLHLRPEHYLKKSR